ncbi:hypothetical protein ACFY0G_45745, partial [Streptomyces sp. NPDC001552]
MTATMVTSILISRRTPESAVAVLHHRLDRIFDSGHTPPPARPRPLRSSYRVREGGQEPAPVH